MSAGKADPRSVFGLPAPRRNPLPWLLIQRSRSKVWFMHSHFLAGLHRAGVSYARVALLFGLLACGRAEAPQTPVAAWQHALLQSQKAELSAGYKEFLQTDPNSPQGVLARERLSLGAQHYQQALRYLQQGLPGAREELLAGKAIAPMAPQLCLPMARALREQKNDYLAQQFYRSFLRHLPHDKEAPIAKQELAQLETEMLVLAMDPEQQESSRSLWTSELIRLLGLGVTLLVVLLGVLAFALRLRLRRDRSLRALAEQNPELQPALTYLIGTLRHELLKHRIGAASQLLSSLTAQQGKLSSEQIQFLHQRLYGGVPLAAVWQEQLQSFQRALRLERSLTAFDRGFAQADRAMLRLIRSEKPLLQGQPRVIEQLAAAESELLQFDRSLATLLRQMQRTVIDGQLLAEAAHAVRSEHRAAQVSLDELQLIPPVEHVEVAVYRVDLLLVLKNLIRNAILAVGHSELQRRIAVDVQIELLDTGEELVLLRVHDSCPDRIPPERLMGTDAVVYKPRGLDLVRMTLRVYGGTLSEAEGLPGFSKCVVAQLFRVLDADVTEKES